jgi:hypothetical protein
MISERPLTAAELLQFERYRQLGFEVLGASVSATPTMLVEVVDEFVDKWQSERRGLSRMFRSRTDAVEPARGLGVLGRSDCSLF